MQPKIYAIYNNKKRKGNNEDDNGNPKPFPHADNLTQDKKPVNHKQTEPISRDGGTKWVPIMPFTENDGSESWAVAPPPTTKAKVRISLVGRPAIKDASNANFKILPPPMLTVTSPNGGETWNAFETETITWTPVIAGAGVTIDLSRNGGRTWETIIRGTPCDGEFDWEVSGLPTNMARIRIAFVADWLKAGGDISDANFTIFVPPMLEVTYPNGGETWTSGEHETITWDSLVLPSGTGLVRIDLSGNGEAGPWKTIIPVTANDESQTWAVFGPATTAKARIRITFLADWMKLGGDMSDSNFTLNKPPPPP